MSETFVEFQTPVVGSDGINYTARACGALQPDGMWHGWIEFVPLGGGVPIRSPRETTQPNRDDTEYWATGLTHVYLEGALQRALNPTRIVPATAPTPPAFDGPAPTGSTVASEAGPATASVLDPFSVYEKGETILRKQLAALSAWHLVNIAVDYGLTDGNRRTLNHLPAAALIDLIVDQVRTWSSQRRRETPTAQRPRRAIDSSG
jgi:hypothetical protein